MSDSGNWAQTLRTNFNKTGITAWGYGPPTLFTKEMVDAGWIELEFNEQQPELWRGRLTHRGMQEREP